MYAFILSFGTYDVNGFSTIPADKNAAALFGSGGAVMI